MALQVPMQVAWGRDCDRDLAPQTVRSQNVGANPETVPRSGLSGCLLVVRAVPGPPNQCKTCRSFKGVMVSCASEADTGGQR